MANLPANWPRNYPVYGKTFLEIVKEFLDVIEERQAENFKKAGKIMGDKIMEGGLITLVATGGHTYLPVLDMSHRAGAFACVNPTLDISSSPMNGGTRSIRVERVEGYYEALMDYFRIKKGDVCIVFNNIGVNAGTIDACLACKKRGRHRHRRGQFHLAGRYTDGPLYPPFLQEEPPRHRGPDDRRL